MSNELREYISCSGNESQNMHITAFVGNNKNKTSIQFIIGMSYCCLNRKQLFDLKRTIDKRLKGIKGYTATDTFSGKKTRDYK